MAKYDKETGVDYGYLQWWTLHWESKLPRPENYKKQTLVHLEKLEKKVARYIGYMQDELTKYPNSACAKVWKPMYEHHYQRILLAIAAKTQKMKAA